MNRRHHVPSRLLLRRQRYRLPQPRRLRRRSPPPSIKLHHAPVLLTSTAASRLPLSECCRMQARPSSLMTQLATGSAPRLLPPILPSRTPKPLPRAALSLPGKRRVRVALSSPPLQSSSLVPLPAWCHRQLRTRSRSSGGGCRSEGPWVTATDSPSSRPPARSG